MSKHILLVLASVLFIYVVAQGVGRIFVTFADSESNQQFAVAPQLGNPSRLSVLRIPNGDGIGFQGYDPDTGISFVTMSYPPSNGPTRPISELLDLEEQSGQKAILANVADASGTIARTFQTWDNNTVKIVSFTAKPLSTAGSQSVKELTMDLALQLDSSIEANSFLDTDGSDAVVNGEFSIRAEYLYRIGNKTATPPEEDKIVIMIAVNPKKANDFLFKDLSDGTNVAAYQDGLRDGNDTFGPQVDPIVDMIWVVDNSLSMDNEQKSVASGAEAMGDSLRNGGLDYRVGLVTTSFYNQNCWPLANQQCNENANTSCRPFTKDLDQFAEWLTPNSKSWIGAGTTFCQTGDEKSLLSLETILSQSSSHAAFVPPADGNDQRIRPNAHLVNILVGDADDQSYGFDGLQSCQDGIDHYTGFFKKLVSDKTVTGLTMGGIVCPDAPGINCGESQCDPRVNRAVVENFGGFTGDVNTGENIKETMRAIVNEVILASSPYQISKAPITASIKVTVPRGSTNGCPSEEVVPRSRENGWDYDPVSRKVAFYGNCRPTSQKPDEKVVITYSYWVKQFSCEAVRDKSVCSADSRCYWCPKFEECRPTSVDDKDCGPAVIPTPDPGALTAGLIGDEPFLGETSGNGNNGGNVEDLDEGSSGVPWWAILLMILGLLCLLLLCIALLFLFLMRNKEKSGTTRKNDYNMVENPGSSQGVYAPPAGGAPQSGSSQATMPYASPQESPSGGGVGEGSAPYAGNYEMGGEDPVGPGQYGSPAGGQATSGSSAPSGGGVGEGGSAPSGGGVNSGSAMSNARSNLKPSSRPMTVASNISPDQMGDPNIKPDSDKYIIAGQPVWPH